MRPAILAALLAACGTDDPPVIGDLERQCMAVADRFCCGLTGDDLVRCNSGTVRMACSVHLTDPVRSNVDFAACNAALDQVFVMEPRLCSCGLGDGGRKGGGGCFAAFLLPDECISDACLTLDNGCVEDNQPYSGEYDR